MWSPLLLLTALPHPSFKWRDAFWVEGRLLQFSCWKGSELELPCDSMETCVCVEGWKNKGYSKFVTEASLRHLETLWLWAELLLDQGEQALGTTLKPPRTRLLNRGLCLGTAHSADPRMSHVILLQATGSAVAVARNKAGELAAGASRDFRGASYRPGVRHAVQDSQKYLMRIMRKWRMRDRSRDHSLGRRTMESWTLKFNGISFSTPGGWNQGLLLTTYKSCHMMLILKCH